MRADSLAGLPGAIASVPDGMAAAVLAGVSPIHGLYASAVGPIAGGLTSSTRMMVITTTSAAALAAGSALQGVPPERRTEALLMLTIVAGAAALAAGLLRFGRYTRFVSLSVMTGFLTGVAVNIVLGQLPDLTGASAHGSVAIAKAWDVVTHPGRIDLPSLAVGVCALGLALLLRRTRLSSVSAVVALVVPTFLSFVFDGIARVSDAGAIPRGLPLPHVPSLHALSLSVITGGLAVAAIVVVQGAGVAEAAPNLDGPPSDANRDFVAQGVANVASGLFRGQPVGGSVGQTAVNLAAGARSRWAAIFSGIWMLAVLGAFSGVVGRVAMPTLAAVLIAAALGALRMSEIRTIVRTGRISQVAIATTFLATLLLPIPEAVGVGVALSLLLQLNREALDLSVVELVPHEGGGFEERPAPAQLRGDAVTMLDVYGSLYYAGARTLAARLPEPRGAERPVVVLRLRGRTRLGATSFAVLSAYSERLGEVGGVLYVSGVDPALFAQFRRAQQQASDRIRVFEASPVLGVSSTAAMAEGLAWLDAQRASPRSATAAADDGRGDDT